MKGSEKKFLLSSNKKRGLAGMIYKTGSKLLSVACRALMREQATPRPMIILSATILQLNKSFVTKWRAKKAKQVGQVHISLGQPATSRLGLAATLQSQAWTGKMVKMSAAQHQCSSEKHSPGPASLRTLGYSIRKY